MWTVLCSSTLPRETSSRHGKWLVEKSSTISLLTAAAIDTDVLLNRGPDSPGIDGRRRLVAPETAPGASAAGRAHTPEALISHHVIYVAPL